MSMDLSKWRIEKAETTFKDGERLEHFGSYHSAINRFYYAAFHAVRALSKKLPMFLEKLKNSAAC